jgi:acetyl-CoA carboxylase / biotin carboxylase 1
MLVPTSRHPGLNHIGMGAWRCTLFTPEFPTGRDIILTANDANFLSGSFGADENDMFLASSKLARRKGIRRIFLAGNSGARFGIASEVRDLLSVSLVGPSDPVKGFNYLAISQSDAESIKDSIATGRALENGVVEISSTIETFNGLGVENLMGSGLIAGESSAAHDETCTLNYVTARSVCIGAYLVRLGQHLVVQDDVHGISAVGDQPNFVPAARAQSLAVVESRESVTREVEGFRPPDGQWSDNAVIEYLVRLGKPEFHRSRQIPSQ